MVMEKFFKIKSNGRPMKDSNRRSELYLREGWYMLCLNTFYGNLISKHVLFWQILSYNNLVYNRVWFCLSMFYYSIIFNCIIFHWNILFAFKISGKLFIPMTCTVYLLRKETGLPKYQQMKIVWNLGSI